MKRISYTEYQKVAWLNGGGFAWDIATEKSTNPENHATFAWRFAMAEIESSGPFSTYEHIDRIITLVTGNGFALSFPQNHETKPIRLANSGDDGSFPGDVVTHCDLNDGVSKVLNIMFARDAYKADVNILSERETNTWAFDCDVLLLFALGDTVEFMLNDQPIKLATYESLILDSLYTEKRINHIGGNDSASCQLYTAALKMLGGKSTWEKRPKSIDYQ